VLKPGGHLLAFSAARTYHHLAITLEQAGFEIRDQIMWIYSSGFPKSQDVGKSIERAAGKKTSKPKLIPYENKQPESLGLGATRGRCPKCLKDQTYQLKCIDAECVLKVKPADNEWSGWGTALKPAHEPICLARKPTKLSIQKNVQKYGTGALNIDATRIASEKRMVLAPKKGTYQCVENSHSEKIAKAENMEMVEYGDRFPSNVIGEITDGYQKYFYCPKVSRRERHAGFDLNVIPTDPSGKYDNGGYSANQETLKSAGNNHPTVKPVELMKYLIKLVTPANGTVLDPFCGSGSTGMAAVELGYAFVGIELDARYCQIASKRIAAWNEKGAVFRELFE